VSRLAPSPSGALHLGNACTFLVNWALARSRGWELVLRIEDLDQPRVRAGAEEEILASLAWLGIDFDRVVERQSRRTPAYEAAVEALAARGLVFASPHSRADVRAAGGSDESDAQPASAPHANAPALRFPRSLRPPPGEGWRFSDRAINYRLRVPDEPHDVVDVVDEVMGPHRFALADDPGDPIVWSKAGVAAYQLAVVVDDGAAGVTDIVRGEDLLQSAAIQTVLARSLGLPVPRWWHLPLIVDEEGRRLSKRDGDLSLAALRARGVRPERVIGLVAWWFGAGDAQEADRPGSVGACGAPPLTPMSAPKPMSSSEFRDHCYVERLRAWHRAPRPRVDAAAHAWLTGR